MNNIDTNSVPSLGLPAETLWKFTAAIQGPQEGGVTIATQGLEELLHPHQALWGNS